MDPITIRSASLQSPPRSDGPDTLSRLEDAVDFNACYRLAVALVQLHLQERDDVPERIVLNFDGTDAPAIPAGLSLYA